MEVIGKTKDESCLKNELNEAVLLCKSYVIAKPSKSIDTIHKGAQSHNENTTEDYKKRSEKMKKFMEPFF